MLLAFRQEFLDLGLLVLVRLFGVDDSERFQVASGSRGIEIAVQAVEIEAVEIQVVSEIVVERPGVERLGHGLSGFRSGRRRCRRLVEAEHLGRCRLRCGRLRCGRLRCGRFGSTQVKRLGLVEIEHRRLVQRGCNRLGRQRFGCGRLRCGRLRRGRLRRDRLGCSGRHGMGFGRRGRRSGLRGRLGGRLGCGRRTCGPGAHLLGEALDCGMRRVEGMGLLEELLGLVSLPRIDGLAGAVEKALDVRVLLQLGLRLLHQSLRLRIAGHRIFLILGDLDDLLKIPSGQQVLHDRAEPGSRLGCSRLRCGRLRCGRLRCGRLGCGRLRCGRLGRRRGIVGRQGQISQVVEGAEIVQGTEIVQFRHESGARRREADLRGVVE